MVPVVPSMANMALAPDNDRSTHEKCLNELQEKLAIAGHKSHKKDADKKNNHECEESCSQGGDCSHFSPCVNSLLSANLYMLTDLKMLLTQAVPSKNQFAKLNTRINTKGFPPTLRPPIC